MKAFKRILVFVFALVLVFSVIAVGGIAADDIQDFVCKAEREKLEAQRQDAQQSTELPVPITAFNSQSHHGAAHSSHIAGDRLETRFDLAPALQGRSNASSRLQVGQITTVAAAAQEQPHQIETVAHEVEHEPTFEHIPPPNTGRGTYLIWGVLGLTALSVGLRVRRKRTAYARRSHAGKPMHASFAAAPLRIRYTQIAMKQ